MGKVFARVGEHVDQAGGLHDFMGFEYSQVGTVEQDAGQQGRCRAGGLTVGVGQPGVHRCQAHFGAVAHQDEHETGFEPQWIQAAGCIGERALLLSPRCYLFWCGQD